MIGLTLGGCLVEKKNKSRKHDPKWKDSTRTARSDKKVRKWQIAAELNGFETWSGMMTFIKNEALKGRAVVNKNNA